MNRIDTTMDDMANTKFLTVYSSLIKQFTASTEFTNTEVVCLLIIYYKFVQVNGPTAKQMKKKQMYNLFLVLFRIYDMTIIERILLNITSDVAYISPEAWMKLFSVFLSKNLDERIQFAYKVYTTSTSGVLNRETVGMAIDNFFVGEDDDEVKELQADMLEYIFNKFDMDKDGIISYEEYYEIVSNQPVLLEFLGQIFPDLSDMTVIAYCTNMSTLFPEED
ncbi:hypothetical protein AWZ03_007723 [Drosophila navojoa]|uniref:EF-hand domain-containing protein n=1 Tax=Drosophila navojoa TaxID=7232 RepID=A0A484BAV4_DRONA|nr:calcineurin subunit B-like [Drosophila navojoa]TDG45868.1 hypothetical protein AWZ03_007723 [Drosophila navojoa]